MLSTALSTVIGFFTGGKGIAIAALAAFLAASLLGNWYLKREYETAVADRATLAAAYERSAAVVVALRKVAKVTSEQLAKLENENEARRGELDTLRERLSHAEDGPLAPVLRDLLDGLRKRDADGNGDGAS